MKLPPTWLNPDDASRDPSSSLDLFPTGFEAGLRNLPLLAPAGSRLEWMQHATDTSLRLLYKPHGARRADLAARTFSSRDIHTEIFAGFRIAQLPDSAVSAIHYDPFHCVLDTAFASGTRGRIDLLASADENAFALASSTPLTVVITPRERFTIEDGCLWERFEDRGEEIISFVLFTSLAANRFRRLRNGSVVLQFFGDECLIFGAEDSPVQLRRLRACFAPPQLKSFEAANEAVLGSLLALGAPTLRDASFQQVADINRRILLSGFDLGGACNSGFNREYNLVWHRDGGLASAEFAAAGNPELARRWASLSVSHPSSRMGSDGQPRPFYSQLLGTRWCKDEEDGWYFAVLSAHAHWRVTGDAALIEPRSLDLLLGGLDTLLTDTYLPSGTDHPAAGLFHCSARCEMMLPSDPNQGNDVVNGRYHERPTDVFHFHGKPVARLWSLYINTLNWQGLKMLAALLRLAPSQHRTAEADRLEALAASLESAILERFRQSDGSWLAERLELADGTHHEVSLADAEMWEMNWALALPPFLFHPELTVPATKKLVEHYTAAERRCYSPWPLQAALLSEFQDTATADAMLGQMVADALTIDDPRFPLQAAMPERGGCTVTREWPAWRPTLFCAAPFLRALSANLLAPLPFGLAARSGQLAEGLERFVYHGCEITVTTTGAGPEVGALTLNGIPINGTLQLPESLLRRGELNTLAITRAATPPGPRLHRSDALLRAIQTTPDKGVSLILDFPVAGTLVWQGDTAGLTASNAGGSPVKLDFVVVPGTRDLAVAQRPAGLLHLTVGP
ncbi:MAG: hypothetical protein NTV93_13545 [Verrucomicrobia bacterium]|nr:hypothetical protein [Verrucomicrobiota bacterium]